MRGLCIVAIGVSVALAGCASHQRIRVYSGHGTTVVTDSAHKTVTIRSREGTMRTGKDVVDVNSLGVPIYDGAAQENGTLALSQSNAAAQTAAFSTADSFERVYAYYKTRMPRGSEKVRFDEGEAPVAEFVVPGRGRRAPRTTVMISRNGEKTAIVITKGMR